jgi:hypothetical protein
LELQDEFGAIAISEDAVFVERNFGIGRNAILRAIEDRIGDFFAHDLLAHAFDDTNEAGASAIDDASFL